VTASRDGAVFGREPSRPLPEPAEPDELDETIDLTDDYSDSDDDDTEELAGLDADDQAALEADLDHDPDPVPALPSDPDPVPVPDMEPVPAPVAEAGRDELSEQFDAAKIGFVDDPLRAVQRAAELVAEALREMERRLRSDADADEPSTEDLRVTFLGYRAVFDAIRSGERPPEG
jgi:hypothetical protein